MRRLGAIHKTKYITTAHGYSQENVLDMARLAKYLGDPDRLKRLRFHGVLKFEPNPDDPENPTSELRITRMFVVGSKKDQKDHKHVLTDNAKASVKKLNEILGIPPEDSEEIIKSHEDVGVIFYSVQETKAILEALRQEYPEIEPLKKSALQQADLTIASGESGREKGWRGKASKKSKRCR